MAVRQGVSADAARFARRGGLALGVVLALTTWSTS